MTRSSKPAPVDVLANLTVGARFAADGQVYVMGEGFQIESVAGRGWFTATDRDGAVRKLPVNPSTRVIVLGTRYS